MVLAQYVNNGCSHTFFEVLCKKVVGCLLDWDLGGEGQISRSVFVVVVMCSSIQSRCVFNCIPIGCVMKDQCSL